MASTLNCFARLVELPRWLKKRITTRSRNHVVQVKEEENTEARQRQEKPIIDASSSQTSNDDEFASAPVVEPPLAPHINISTTTLQVSESNHYKVPNPIALPSANSQLATPGVLRRNSDTSNLSRSESKASSSANGHWLKTQLRQARIRCPPRPHNFIIPKSLQEELITEAIISKDIAAHDPTVHERKLGKYAKLTYQHARQLYATLALIDKGADICSLIEEGVRDDDLPFVEKPNASSKFALYRKNGKAIETLDTWTDDELEDFDRCQYWIIAPVFRLHEELYSLDAKVVLPFMPLRDDEAELEPKQGGYSEVYPVRIHPAHHEFSTGQGFLEQDPLVAVKRLFNSDLNEFIKEESILKAMGSKKKPHPHLVKLLASFKQEGKYHLMFPYANANLRGYWDDRPRPEFDRATVLWSLKQMTGIASGLSVIHKFSPSIPLSASPGAGNVRVAKDMQLFVQKGEQWFGRHGDIKPENMLWYKNDPITHDPNGVLQIADFGLGRFHGRDSRSAVNPDTVQTSPTYEPPECKLHKPVSRAYDIWSLGCLYLEFVTWLLQGSLEIEGFSNFRGRENTGTGIDDDNFFTIVNTLDGSWAIVRDTVVQWTQQLYNSEKSSQLIHDILDLIMKDLLVVEPKDRCDATRLYLQLNFLLKRAESDEEYMLTPVPQPSKPANERAKSAPTVSDIPQVRPTSKSVTSPATMKGPSTKVLRHDQPPRDLVLRAAGTPSFKIGVHPTWPGGNKQQMAH